MWDILLFQLQQSSCEVTQLKSQSESWDEMIKGEWSLPLHSTVDNKTEKGYHRPWCAEQITLEH